LAFSYWFGKPRFLTEGRLATVLIIPSSWGGYLPASSIFSGAVAGEKEDFCKGSLARTIFYFVICFALLYFCLHLFIKNTQKLASLVVVISLLLVHYVIPYIYMLWRISQ
jgi:Ca2+/Na+ antiporter